MTYSIEDLTVKTNPESNTVMLRASANRALLVINKDGFKILDDITLDEAKFVIATLVSYVPRKTYANA